MNFKRRINILWTGGLDSTCRVVELSRYPYIVQPYYLIDPSRRSTKNEMKAMTDIRGLLLQNYQTMCELLPIKYVCISDIPTDEVISNSWQKLHESFGLGIQYDWLARYASYNNIKLEMGLQFSPVGRVARTIESLSSLSNIQEKEYHVLTIDQNHSSQEVIDVFGNFLFPFSLYHKKKYDEMLMIREWTGNDDIVKRTWFCHHPVFGLPCGHCHPCQDVRKEGMSWRLSYIGYILGCFRLILFKISGLFRK